MLIKHGDVALSSPKTKLKLFGALALRSKSESKFYLTVDFMANLMLFLATRSLEKILNELGHPVGAGTVRRW